MPLSKTGAELLFEVFSQRYEGGSTLVTSNLPFDEWTEVFGSERLIPTVIDQNPCAHLGMPRDMIFHGWSMRLFQAWQHSATMSS